MSGGVCGCGGGWAPWVIVEWLLGEADVVDSYDRVFIGQAWVADEG